MRNMMAAAAVAAMLSGCAQPGPYGTDGGLNKQTGGAILGAVGGGLLGSQFGGGSGKLAATAFGTILGAFLGSEVGKSLDRADAAYANQASQRAFETAPTGQGITWNNPDNGHTGTITPTQTFQPAPGQYCREYEQTITVGGQKQRSYGTACRQPDGTWKVQG